MENNADDIVGNAMSLDDPAKRTIDPDPCGKLPDTGLPAECPCCHKPFGKHPRKRDFHCPFCASHVHREGQYYFTEDQYRHRHNRCFFCGKSITYPHITNTDPFDCPHCGGVMEWPDPAKYPRGYGRVIYMCLTCRQGRVFILGDIAHADRPAPLPRRPMPRHGKCYFCWRESAFVYTENVDRILTTAKIRPKTKSLKFMNNPG